jgi:NhaA family Na+:H+ antiporter
VAVSIITALVVGKLIGVMGTTAVVTRFTALRLAPGLGIRDLLPVGFLTGIGFTVALLLAELSFTDEEQVADAKTAVLAASVLAALLGALALRWDAHRARRADMNDDGVPDEVTELIGDEE